MGVFSNFFNYSKPGPGVDKDEEKKRRFFLFFELFFRKFWKMIQLNLLYLVCWIPAVFASLYLADFHPLLGVVGALVVGAVTIGPATAGAVYVLRCYTTETPVFLASDFFRNFKENFKQSAAAFLFNALLLYSCYVSYNMYGEYFGGGFLSIVFKALVLLMGIVVLFETFHVFLVIVTVDLKFKDVLKNCFLFSVLNFFRNFWSLVFGIGFLWIEYLFYPLSGFVFPFFGFIVSLFIFTFNAYPVVEKYIINPYYEENKPDEQEESPLFED